MASVSSLESHVVETPPSCVAFCPTNPELFVVGTYFLHRNEDIEDAQATETIESPDESSGQVSQKRTGALQLYQLSGTKVTHRQTENLDSAVLDIEWCPHTATSGSLLCVATSTGSLIFYKLNDEVGDLQLSAAFQVCEASTLVLDLVWHPERADVIGITLSDGRVALCQSTGADIAWTAEAHADLVSVCEHTLEPWTLAFSPGCKTLYSGGDDAVLQRSNIEDLDNAYSQWQDRRIHQAGVTAILPLADNLIVTGSYDDHIRLVSAPAVGRRQVIAEENLGGGVWRLKLLDVKTDAPDALSSYTILASCMHAGSRVVRLRRTGSLGDDEMSSNWQFEVLAAFEEHKSMNYGTDVQPGTGSLRTVVRHWVIEGLVQCIVCLGQFKDKYGVKGETVVE